MSAITISKQQDANDGDADGHFFEVFVGFLHQFAFFEKLHDGVAVFVLDRVLKNPAAGCCSRNPRKVTV